MRYAHELRAKNYKNESWTLMLIFNIVLDFIKEI